MGRYSKFFVSVSGVMAVVSAALSDGIITAAEVSQVVGVAASAILVFVVPNALASNDDA